MEAVERRIWSLLQTDGACPESSCGITFSVVEAIVGQICLWISDCSALAAGFIKEEKAVVARPDQAAALAWHDCADSLADVPDLFIATDRIEVNDFVGFNIHIKKAVTVPDRPLAPFRYMCSDRFCFNHRLSVFESDAVGK